MRRRARHFAAFRCKQQEQQQQHSAGSRPLFFIFFLARDWQEIGRSFRNQQNAVPSFLAETNYFGGFSFFFLFHPGTGVRGKCCLATFSSPPGLHFLEPRERVRANNRVLFMNLFSLVARVTVPCGASALLMKGKGMESAKVYIEARFNALSVAGRILLTTTPPKRRKKKERDGGAAALKEPSLLRPVRVIDEAVPLFSPSGEAAQPVNIATLPAVSSSPG